MSREEVDRARGCFIKMCRAKMPVVSRRGTFEYLTKAWASVVDLLNVLCNIEIKSGILGLPSNNIFTFLGKLSTHSLS